MERQDAAGTGRAERHAGALRSLRAETRLPPRPGLPARQASFVGREEELAAVAALLANPACRLLTICGPGGIGKTQLALEVAANAREGFADGVAFAELQGLGGGDALAPAVAAALGCPLAGREDAREQVARFLRPARLLLVLDNFEHLIEEAPWLGALLAAAPGLSLLVTSREALNLREEWRYPLAGLALPVGEGQETEHADAVRLFAERARQVRPDFSLAAEWAGVARLCRLTEGLPLALELAAAWTTSLPAAAIADEIGRTSAFLTTRLRNTPARHHSMQAAFDHSWALLAEDERRVFRRLAVFRGGCDRDAAVRVAGATLPLLTSLVDKSLLRRDPAGRYQLHELLRQSAEERLRAEPGELASAEAAHRDFYLAFVAACSGALLGGDQRGALATLATEADNIRAAWRRAVAMGDGEAIGAVAHTLAVFHDLRTRYREGLALLEEGLRVLRAAAPSPQIDRALAAMLVDAARFHVRLLDLPAVRAALAESEERFARLAEPPPRGHLTDPHLWRGILALLEGHYAEAARVGAEAVRRNEAADRPGNLSLAWWVRGAAALWMEDGAAGEYARRGAEAAIAAGDRWHLAYCRNQQGHVAVARGDYDAARRHYEASYAIREEFGDPEGMAGALNHLASVAARQGRWAEAEGSFGRSLAISRGIDDRGAIVYALNGLGMVACAGGDLAAAGRYFAEGLQLAVEARYARFVATFLASVGDWLLRMGRPTEAAEPLALVRDHAASDPETRARARQLLATAAAALPRAEYDAATGRGREADPAELAARFLPALTAPAASPPASPRPAPADSLVEPLTARELAVLRLIAAGRSNREIADELFLALNTVRSYSQQLYGKLGVGSRTQAVARARELGMLG